MIKLIYHLGVDSVIYKNADGIIAFCQKDSILIAGKLNKMNGKAIFPCQWFKPDTVQ